MISQGAPDRDTVIALLDEAVRTEARAEPPPDGERHAWLFGNTGWADPDEHGWIAPTKPDLWIPRALCFWQGALAIGGTITRAQRRHPDHALHRWPDIEAAVGDYLLASPWLIAPE